MFKKGPIRSVKPMLAILEHNPILDQNWILEPKWDGFRALVISQNQNIKILSRNQFDLTPEFPELIKAFQAFKQYNFIMDGEIVVLNNKISRFSGLQERLTLGPSKLALRKLPVRFCAFDLIYFEGFYLENLSLLDRKKILKKYFLPFKIPLIHTPVYPFKQKNRLIEKFKSAGWEGLIAKRTDSTYQHTRSPDWVKIKWARQAIFWICGFTLPKTQTRLGMGALLLGYYDTQRNLQYVGKVGTGFTHILSAELYNQLIKLQTKKIPFLQIPIRDKHIIWVKPILQAEIQFTEWTADRKLRHPSFIKLRSKIQKNIKL